MRIRNPLQLKSTIRKIGDSDAHAVLEIYRQGLDSGEASFETEPPDWTTWKRKYHPFCRLAWEEEGQLLGWAALAPVSARNCYSGVAEVSIYVASDHLGKGIGSRLMAGLVEASESNGIWSLYSSIFPENGATLRLHLRHGFREVGIRERIARQHGRWRNTLILERRSARVGV
jgi:phosphinothricin acetyltransferase